MNHEGNNNNVSLIHRSFLAVPLPPREGFFQSCAGPAKRLKLNQLEPSPLVSERTFSPHPPASFASFPLAFPLIARYTAGMDKKQALKVYSAAVICHVFWGFSFMASGYALKIAHVFLLLSHRFLLAFALMSLLVLFRFAKLKLRGKRVWLLIVLGLLEPVIYFFGEQYGILHSGTVFSGVMIAMIPVFCTLAAALILRERPTAGQVIFSVISVAGVIGLGLMGSSSGTVELIGVIALIVAVIGATGYTLLSRRLSAEFSPFERTYMMIAVGAVVFTVCAAAVCKGDPAEYIRPFADVNYLLCVLFLSVCCSVICYFMSSYTIT